jgi:chromosome segregation protein
MLKALELSGFKSFADKTRLDFHAGVTCVVGPNGSGKSNVVDAIKWVTGTQSAKSLRGSEMTDVIFNGASGRRPMNAAEVTLEFDNSTGLFDLQAPVARFTRRVYRSGEGEYLINGAPSRLRDIRNLLAGTGVGSEAYSIIEQGRVDALLRASPKDRRGIFEEAAGVSRFRLKKQEAGKRLARVEQNLLRLSDIVDEVEGRLRRVKKQAGKAQRYRDSAQRLKELRTQVGLADWRSLGQREERLQAEIDQLTHEQETGAATLAEAEVELQRLELEGRAASERLSDADKRLAGVRESMGAARARSEGEAARIKELNEELRHKRNRLAGALAQRTASESAPTTNPGDQLELAKRALAEAQHQLAASQSELEAANTELAQVKESAAMLAEQLTETQDATTKSGRQQEQLTKLLGENQERRRKTAEKLALTADQQSRLEVELGGVTERAATSHAALEASTAAMAQKQAATAGHRRQLRDCQKRLAAAEAEAVSLRHRAMLIEQLETDLDSLRDSVAQQNDEARWSVQGILADLLNVDYDSAPMVEAALGDRAHHLVIDSGEQLLASLADGERPFTGRASLERLDCQPAASVVDRVDLSGEPGVMGRADQFVESEPRYAPLVRRLLGRVWFVDSLSTAERLSRGLGRGLSFVTYQGESLTADGVLTIGPKDDTRCLLTRKARADELRAALQENEQAIERLSGEIETLEAAVAQGEADELAELAQRTQASDDDAEARHAAKRLEEQLAACQEESAKRTSEVERLEQLVAETTTSLQAVRVQAVSLHQERDELTRRHNELRSQEAALAARAADIQNGLVERQVAFARTEQRVEVLQSQLDETEHSSAERERSCRQALEEVADCRRRLAGYELRLLGASGELNELCLESEQLTATRRSVEAAATAAQDRRSKISQAVRQRRELVDRCGAQRQQFEIELAEVRHSQRSLSDKLRDDYGINLSEAAQTESPRAIEDRQALEREIAELREDVHTVGSVNLESIEELDDLEARFNELSAQYQDLSEAKNSLEKLTQKINAETRKLFLTTIEAVRGEFRELFRQLFGGGEADILLVDGAGDDPLDAGVEIAAQPPGKDLSNISLLSGGEKTLTCVALLLALFRSKPSPFCVLDEVDAALDEANIGRFTGVLSEFLSSTQFIVITHSKKTMTGADTMYGITMQESGVSKQVAVRFEEVTEDGNIRPAKVMGVEKRAA